MNLLIVSKEGQPKRYIYLKARVLSPQLQNGLLPARKQIMLFKT